MLNKLQEYTKIIWFVNKFYNTKNQQRNESGTYETYASDALYIMEIIYR